MSLLYLGHPTTIQAGDTAFVRILSPAFTIAKVRFLRGVVLLNGESLNRGEKCSEFSLPVNTAEGVNLSMRMIAMSCGLGLKKLETTFSKGELSYEFIPSVRFEKIRVRAKAASEKIAGKIKELLPEDELSLKAKGKMWPYDIRDDFFVLVNKPNDECGGGNYKDWTVEEIKELFFVLYGEELGG
jgi:hypothetical protein